MPNGEVSLLEKYGEDYTKKEYVTDPAIARDEEIKQVLLVLLTPDKSAILVGKAGIGKTAIVEGIAYRIQKGLVPEVLKGMRVVKVSVSSIMGTAISGGVLEQRLEILVNEIKKAGKGNLILFIDEVHLLINRTENNSMDFAN
ncbi:MAG TPA: AAA family ATPase, partial [Bacilli bacterium]|nr:AAA family ATPase [Bacilli bacterium]